MAMKKNEGDQICTECKTYPVRQNGKYLCFSCFEVALRDLLRSEGENHASNGTNETS